MGIIKILRGEEEVVVGVHNIKYASSGVMGGEKVIEESQLKLMGKGRNCSWGRRS